MWMVFEKTLELLYYASGVALAILACFGLKQLALARESIKQNSELAKTSAKREAYRLAADQCQFYLGEVIPLCDNCGVKLRTSGVLEQLDRFQVSNTGEAVCVTPPKDFDSNAFDALLMAEDSVRAMLSVANALEGFAVPFVSGVAAEAVSFNSVGSSFCFTTKQYAPFIVPFAGRTHYKNVLQLFHIWQARLDQEQLREQSDKIAEQLSKTQAVRIKPLGT